MLNQLWQNESCEKCSSRRRKTKCTVCKKVRKNRIYDILRVFESTSSILKFVSVNMSDVYLAICEAVHIWESYTHDSSMEQKFRENTAIWLLLRWILQVMRSWNLIERQKGPILWFRWQFTIVATGKTRHPPFQEAARGRKSNNFTGTRKIWVSPESVEFWDLSSYGRLRPLERRRRVLANDQNLCAISASDVSCKRMITCEGLIYNCRNHNTSNHLFQTRLILAYKQARSARL